MADLPESNEWVAGIYQLETSDPVLGGPEGIDNKQAKQLASRTKWLKDQIQKIVEGVISIGKAKQLETARALKFTGAAEGSGTYDGSADTDIKLTLANSGITAGTYTKVTFNGKGIATGGSNPTSLEGYGINDALPLAGGTLTGAINMADAKSLYIQTVNSPSWAAGVIAGQLGGEKAGLGFQGNQGTVNRAFMALGATPWANGNGIRVSTGGVEIAGPINGDGTGLTNLKYSALVGTPNSLAGYGVAFASQSEAESGADTNKPVNALRVFQAIVKKVVQATESTLGTARIGNQLEVNAGTDNAVIITPKKLRWGFQMVIGRTGYIVFPTWLNGWIVQWSAGLTLTGHAINTTRFPIPFPNDVGAVVVGAYNNTASGEYSVRLSDGAGGSAGAVFNDCFKTYNTGLTGAAGLSYLAVGT